VTYRLHPTFPKPIRVSDHRASGFRLQSAGWGEFTISIEIQQRDGSIKRRFHHLKLEDGSGGGEDEPRPPIVFISFSLADSKLANSLRTHLESREIEVVCAADMSTAGNWEALLKAAIGGCDALVAIMSDASTASVEQERRRAVEAHIQVFSVVIGDGRSAARSAQHEEVIYIKDESELDSAIPRSETGIWNAVKRAPKNRAPQPKPRKQRQPGKRS
jgi:hypothetical protein